LKSVIAPKRSAVSLSAFFPGEDSLELHPAMPKISSRDSMDVIILLIKFLP
jgi:hypothetical protein